MSRTIRLPSNQVHLISKINRTISEFEQQHERKPSNEELEKLLKVPAKKISYILSVANKTVSVDSPLKDEEEGTLVDVIPNQNAPHADAALREESKNKEIAMILKKLSWREHDILRMFFGLGCDSMTLENISTKFGLTSERVRQVKDSAIKSLQGKHLEYVKRTKDMISSIEEQKSIEKDLELEKGKSDISSKTFDLTINLRYTLVKNKDILPFYN